LIFLVITEFRPLQKNAQTFFVKLKPDKKVTIILQKSFQIKAKNGQMPEETQIKHKILFKTTCDCNTCDFVSVWQGVLFSKGDKCAECMLIFNTMAFDEDSKRCAGLHEVV